MPGIQWNPEIAPFTLACCLDTGEVTLIDVAANAANVRASAQMDATARENTPLFIACIIGCELVKVAFALCEFVVQ